MHIMYKFGSIQYTSATADKECNRLRCGTTFYVAMSYKLLKIAPV